MAELTNFAKSYIHGQPEDVQFLLRRVLDDLPDGVECHRQEDFLRFYKPENEKWCVWVRARPRLKRLDIIINANSTDDGGLYLEKMKAIGVNAPQAKYVEWGAEEGNRLNVALSSASLPEHFLALKQYLYWFLVESPATDKA